MSTKVSNRDPWEGEIYRLYKPRTPEWPDRLVLSVDGEGNFLKVRNYNADTGKVGPTTSNFPVNSLSDRAKHLKRMSRKDFAKLFSSKKAKKVPEYK